MFEEKKQLYVEEIKQAQQRIDDAMKQLMENRYERDLELSKNPTLFGTEGPQPLTIETGPWSANGPRNTPCNSNGK